MQVGKFGSLTVTGLSVVSPVLRTVKVKVALLPVLTTGVLTVLLSVMFETWMTAGALVEALIVRGVWFGDPA